MKQTETYFKTKKRYVAITLICFLYGGFSIFMLSFGVYSSFWKMGLLNPVKGGFADVNADLNQFADGLKGFAGTRKFGYDPIAFICSPTNLVYLAGGVIAILAGLAIWSLIRQKELKSVKQAATANLLLPDENAVIEALKDSGYELTQSKLTKETGLSKVQVHRVIKRLESKRILEKHDYGVTNKIILKKEFFD